MAVPEAVALAIMAVVVVVVPSREEVAWAATSQKRLARDHVVFHDCSSYRCCSHHPTSSILSTTSVVPQLYRLSLVVRMTKTEEKK